MKVLFYVWIFSVGIVIGIMFGSVWQCHDDKIKIDSLSANLADTLKREESEKKRADECTVNYSQPPRPKGRGLKESKANADRKDQTVD